MKIHEYQGKKIFSDYGMPVQDGYIFEKLEDAESTIKRVQKDFNTQDVVVKAQIHAGGRGKGGGVKYSPNFEEALENAKNIFGMNLVTHQTGAKGQLVKKVYVTEAFDISKEYYAAITLDRGKGMDVFMVSTEGGMEIEKVAEEDPEKITKIHIDPLLGINSFQAKKLAYALGLSGDAFKSAVKVFMRMYQCYQGTDATIVEVNPLVISNQDQILALDCKMSFDNNALFRRNQVSELRDKTQENSNEVYASDRGLSYVSLDGNIGNIINGAGLAMASMDMIKLAGGEPANFLDVGGGATPEKIVKAFKLISMDKKVKVILVNIFAGINRCDWVAEGIVQALQKIEIKVPLVIRLAGTNVDKGNKILKESKINYIEANTLEDAANKAVKALGK